MIKIIEHGTIKRKQCEHCGCLFSYEKEDIMHEKLNNQLDPLSYCRSDYILCPQCEFKIRLKTLLSKNGG